MIANLSLLNFEVALIVPFDLYIIQLSWICWNAYRHNKSSPKKNCLNQSHSHWNRTSYRTYSPKRSSTENHRLSNRLNRSLWTPKCLSKKHPNMNQSSKSRLNSRNFPSTVHSQQLQVPWPKMNQLMTSNLSLGNRLVAFRPAQTVCVKLTNIFCCATTKRRPLK